MILLNPQDRRPLYEQVAEKLSALMTGGILEQNAPLPSVRTLASDLAISPNTIQKAYADLERKGFIYSVKGKGSFVADKGQIIEANRRELKNRLREWAILAFGAGIPLEEARQWMTEYYGKEGNEL